jgi:RNA polymerase sigma factor (sigma-70 family)
MGTRKPSDKCNELTDEEDKLREQLIVDHLPLTNQLAARYINSGYGYDDLVSEARVALVEAAAVAVRLVTDGNYGAFLNNAITWHLRKLVRNLGRRAKLVNIGEESDDVLQRPARSCCAPYARLNYQEILETLELSEHEIDVLKLKLQGYTHEEIAARLRLSHKNAVTRALQRIGERYARRRS